MKLTRQLLRIIPLLVLMLSGTSCVMFQPRDPIDEKTLMPETFSATNQTVALSSHWWEDFGNPDINQAISNAFMHNLNLAQAEARLRQAKAQAEKAGAALIPDISLAANAGVTRQHLKADPMTGESITTDTENYALGGLAASYEVDLWGRVRSTRNAASGQYQASRQDLLTAYISVSGDVTDAWLENLEMQAQQALLQKQLETSKTLTELLKMRQRYSQSTALSVYQQEQSAAGIEALMPQVATRLNYLTNSINILLGRPVSTPLEQSATQLPQLPPLPALGIPTDLLTNRPDIQAAQQRLKAAGCNLAAAKADRLPALRLNGSGTYQSGEFGQLFDNWILNIASGLTAPLIDGGRRTAEVRRQQAILDEYLAKYKYTVIKAVADVENALHREQQQEILLAAQQRELDFANKALNEAETRYRQGSIDYLNVMAALTAAQRLDRQLISAQRSLLSYRVALYRSLGCSWGEVENHPISVGTLSIYGNPIIRKD